MVPIPDVTGRFGSHLREVAMKKLDALYCVSHRPSIFSHPDVYERRQEFNLLILVWLHLHETRFPLSATYM